jgi:hypothetical protein
MSGTMHVYEGERLIGDCLLTANFLSYAGAFSFVVVAVVVFDVAVVFDNVAIVVTFFAAHDYD